MLGWTRGWKPAPGRDLAPDNSLDTHAGQLQRDLESTQDYLHAIIEQHEATVEELKSSHEELLSTNEEYQSVNEELETAKEELQSGNEELITTNEELLLRNADLREVTSALEASRDYAKAIVETIGESLLVLDGTLKVVQANHAFYEWFETKPELTEQRFIYDLGEGEWNIPGLRALFEEILPKDAHFRDYEMTHDFRTIGRKTMRLNARRLAGDALRPELILLAIDDISARAEREQFALIAEKERYRTTLASISEAVIATNDAGHVEYLNGVAEQYTGWSNEEAQGKPLARVFNVLDASTRKPLGNVAKIAMVDGRTAGVGTHRQLLRRGGEEFPVEAVAAPLHGPDGNAIVGVVVSFRDVSSQRRLSEKLSYQANHDALTGLVNRREFERRLRRLIESFDASQSHALLYLDLDQFKLINDTCGHSAGDEMLRQVTAILHTQLRARDTLARLGGDEFGVLLEHCPLEEALRVANDLRRAVHDFRFVSKGRYFTLGLSVGLVSVTESDGSLEAVLGVAVGPATPPRTAGATGCTSFSWTTPRWRNVTATCSGSRVFNPRWPEGDSGFIRSPL
ncbi:MAG: diguanylate cyclase domain-containing protein [Gammaproteobacteria bacterium]